MCEFYAEFVISFTYQKKKRLS